MIKNLIRGYVEGVGSKTLAFIGAGLLAALIAPILHAKLGIEPSVTFDFLVGTFIVILAGVAKIWHTDIKTEGKSTTAALMTIQALQAAEKLTKDGTPLDDTIRRVIKEMQEQSATKGEEPAPVQVPPPAPPQ